MDLLSSRALAAIGISSETVIGVIVIIVAVVFFVLTFFFFGGFFGSAGCLLFFDEFSAKGLNLSQVESRCILLTHEGEFSRFASHISLFDATSVFVLLLQDQQSLDFDIFLTLGPLTRGIGFLFSGRDAEFDKRLKASQKPFFNELSEDNFEFTGGWIHSLSEAVGQVEDDFNEFEENDLATTDVNEMLADNLLPPVFLELNHLRFFTNSSSFFINLRLVSFGVLPGLSNNIGIKLNAFGLSC